MLGPEMIKAGPQTPLVASGGHKKAEQSFITEEQKKRVE